MVDIKEALYESFDDIKSRKGRGGTYDYVSWKDVADRMNEVFGMNWSSSVMEQETINDQIIIRVSVCAKDPVSKELFCQEGFGGSVLRSSDEAGSAHKGAYLKALKDACKKWGIGLHLVDDNQSSDGGYRQQMTPPSQSAPPSAPLSQTPAQSMPPDVPTPKGPITNQASPAKPSQGIPPSIPSGFTGYETAPAPPNTRQGPPSPPSPPSAGPAPVVNLPPSPGMPPEMPSTNNSVTQSINDAGFPQAPPSMSSNNQPFGATAPIDEPNADVPGSINNVQEMAIKNLARLGNFETPESLIKFLVAKSDNEVSRVVTNVNDLSYDEAVLVIKTAKNQPKAQ